MFSVHRTGQTAVRRDVTDILHAQGADVSAWDRTSRRRPRPDRRTRLRGHTARRDIHSAGRRCRPVQRGALSLDRPDRASGPDDGRLFDVVRNSQQITFVNLGGKRIVLGLESKHDRLQIIDAATQSMVLVREAYIIAADISKEGLGHV